MQHREGLLTWYLALPIAFEFVITAEEGFANCNVNEMNTETLTKKNAEEGKSRLMLLNSIQ